MKVHITFKEVDIGDIDAMKTLLDDFLSVISMTAINHKRFKKYGLLSGDIDPSFLLTVQSMERVHSVSIDQERYTL